MSEIMPSEEATHKVKPSELKEGPEKDRLVSILVGVTFLLIAATIVVIVFYRRKYQFQRLALKRRSEVKEVTISSTGRTCDEKDPEACLHDQEKPTSPGSKDEPCSDALSISVSSPFERTESWQSPSLEPRFVQVKFESSDEEWESDDDEEFWEEQQEQAVEGGWDEENGVGGAIPPTVALDNVVGSTKTKEQVACKTVKTIGVTSSDKSEEEYIETVGATEEESYSWSSSAQPVGDNENKLQLEACCEEFRIAKGDHVGSASAIAAILHADLDENEKRDSGDDYASGNFNDDSFVTTEEGGVVCEDAKEPPTASRDPDRREEEDSEGVEMAVGASSPGPRLTCGAREARSNRGRPIDTIATALAQVRARQEESLGAASVDEETTTASDDVVLSPVSTDDEGSSCSGGERPSEDDSTTEGIEQGRAEERMEWEPPTGGSSSDINGTKEEAPPPSAPSRGEAATQSSGGPQHANVKVATGDETEAPSFPSSKLDGSDKENEDEGEMGNIHIHTLALHTSLEDPLSDSEESDDGYREFLRVIGGSGNVGPAPTE